jgi:hypothetical protein
MMLGPTLSIKSLIAFIVVLLTTVYRSVGLPRGIGTTAKGHYKIIHALPW